MLSVSASEIQKNFGEWFDKALAEPVAITRYGRTSGYLISAALFDQISKHFRDRSDESPMVLRD